MKNILVFAAHPDDELLGVGGTVRRLVDEGADARAVILAEGLTSRTDHRADTAQNELIRLQEDARKAAREVGYTSIDFCGFPDNRMDGIDLLNVVKMVSGYVEKYHPDIVSVMLGTNDTINDAYEENLKKIEAHIREIRRLARSCGLSEDELLEIFRIMEVEE